MHNTKITFKSGESITHCFYSGVSKTEADFTYDYFSRMMFLGRPIDIISGITNSVMVNYISLECQFDEKKTMVFQVIMKGTTL